MESIITKLAALEALGKKLSATKASKLRKHNLSTYSSKARKLLSCSK